MNRDCVNLLHNSSQYSTPSLSTLTTILKDIRSMRWEWNTSRESFRDKFCQDPLVISHVDGIVQLELETGSLLQDQKLQRRHQLMKWFADYYYSQLHSISNIDTDTRNHLLQLHTAYILFHHILPTIFKDGIWIHRDTFHAFKERARATQAPILLLPNHQSHIDYIIIHFLYVISGLSTPLVIAGDNLNVPVFGPILKKLGAIFIKRRFTKDDFWYKSSMKHLLHSKLQLNPQIELFIEGTRSRNGKLMLPKTGFVQLIRDSLNGQQAHIQPISLVYEKPYEFQEYLVELNGMDKKQESFSSIFNTGVSLLSKKSPNFGKLVINFDTQFITMNDNTDVKQLCNTVMHRIHEIEYITEISVIGLALTILFYRDVHVKKIAKLETITLVKQLTTMLLRKNTQNDHLLALLDLDDDALIQFTSDQLTKFLKEYIHITDHSFVIIEETALVYFKNSLLNNFISEMFLLKTQHHLPTLQILKRLFYFEFLTTTIDETAEISPTTEKLFKKLLDPFIESYEVVLKNLEGVISIQMKTWLHLLYLSSPNVTYKESMNKSNLLYAIYTLQSLSLIEITRINHVKIIDDSGLVLFKNYLHSLRKGEPLIQEDEVLRRVLHTSSRL